MRGTEHTLDAESANLRYSPSGYPVSVIQRARGKARKLNSASWMYKPSTKRSWLLTRKSLLYILKQVEFAENASGASSKLTRRRKTAEFRYQSGTSPSLNARPVAICDWSSS